MSKLTDAFKKRLWEENQNVLLVITGLPGTGKSYTALKIAEICSLPGRFSIKNVVFSGDEFMDLLNFGNLQKGDWIVFDEAGVSLSSRQWNSVTNKLLNFVLQTCRHRNLGIIFNAPDYSFIDSSTRKLFMGYIETEQGGINRQFGYNEVKYFNLDPKSRFKKIYYRFQRVWTKNGPVVIAKTRVYLPSKELISEYEPKKTSFTTTLNKDISDTLQIIKGQRQEQLKETRITPEEMAKVILENPDKYGIKESKKGIKKADSELLATLFGVGGRYGQRAKKLVEQELNAVA